MTKQNWEKEFDKEFDMYNPIYDDGKTIPVWSGSDFENIKSFIRQLLTEQEGKIIRLAIRHYSEFMEEVWKPYRGSKTCGEVAIEWFKKLDEK